LKSNSDQATTFDFVNLIHNKKMFKKLFTRSRSMFP
jgi:hypothetical protein